jgi:hypothetical protein
VVYYSLTGSTSAVAVPLAKELGADIEEIQCDRYVPSIRGYLRAGYDSSKANTPHIGLLAHNPSNYGHVAVARPIWAHHPATPLRAFLREFQTQLTQVALILTYGGSGAEQSLREMGPLHNGYRLPRSLCASRTSRQTEPQPRFPSPRRDCAKPKPRETAARLVIAAHSP